MARQVSGGEAERQAAQGGYGHATEAPTAEFPRRRAADHAGVEKGRGRGQPGEEGQCGLDGQGGRTSISDVTAEETGSTVGEGTRRPGPRREGGGTSEGR